MSSFKLKVLLTGAAAVGKRRLIQRFIKHRFAADYKLTVGVDILTEPFVFGNPQVALDNTANGSVICKVNVVVAVQVGIRYRLQPELN